MAISALSSTELLEIGADVDFPDTDDDLGYPSYQGCSTGLNDNIRFQKGLSVEFPDTDDELGYPSYRNRSERPSADIGRNDQSDALAAPSAIRSNLVMPVDACIFSPCVLMPGVCPWTGMPAIVRVQTSQGMPAVDYGSAPTARPTQDIATPVRTIGEVLRSTVPAVLPSRVRFGWDSMDHRPLYHRQRHHPVDYDRTDSDDSFDGTDSESSSGEPYDTVLFGFEDDDDFDSMSASSDSSSSSIDDSIIDKCKETICSNACEEVCTICLDTYSFGQCISSFPVCMHEFHRECLLPWLKRRPKCPNCRQNLLPIRSR